MRRLFKYWDGKSPDDDSTYHIYLSITGVTANSVHPGFVVSEIFGKGKTVFAKICGVIAYTMGKVSTYAFIVRETFELQLTYKVNSSVLGEKSCFIFLISLKLLPLQCCQIYYFHTQETYAHPESWEDEYFTFNITPNKIKVSGESIDLILYI